MDDFVLSSFKNICEFSWQLGEMSNCWDNQNSIASLLLWKIKYSKNFSNHTLFLCIVWFHLYCLMNEFSSKRNIFKCKSKIAFGLTWCCRNVFSNHIWSVYSNLRTRKVLVSILSGCQEAQLCPFETMCDFKLTDFIFFFQTSYFRENVPQNTKKIMLYSRFQFSISIFI